MRPEGVHVVGERGERGDLVEDLVCQRPVDAEAACGSEAGAGVLVDEEAVDDVEFSNFAADGSRVDGPAGWVCRVDDDGDGDVGHHVVDDAYPTKIRDGVSGGVFGEIDHDGEVGEVER